MANRSNESDEFYQGNTPGRQLSPAGFQESEERIVRRSDLRIALERKIPIRRSSTGTTDKPVLVQGKVKRKRRPPKIPWKKPAGMPKRPLSAYNLFFAYERERLLKEAFAEKDAKSPDKMDVDTDSEDSPKTVGSSDDASDQTKDSTGSPEKKAGSRRHTRTSGIGFANLAKTIASAWNTLDDDNRAIFVGRAAGEKERYQGEMVIWRAKEQKAKSESGADGDDTKAKSKPKVLKRRQSSPPDASATTQPKPDSPPSQVPARRFSEPILLNNPAFSFSFDRAISYHESESLSWAEPMDGGSLGSVDQQDWWWESTLDVGITPSRTRPTPRRSYSDSMLQIQPDNYDIRPCEELAADLGMRHGGATATMAREEAKETSATQSSLQALQASLDDDMVDFITTLSKSEI
jgi:hypothetical protein